MTYRRSFAGLGQVKTATKTGTTAAAPDRTWQDVSAMTTAGGGIVSSIIGAATGQQQLPAAQQPIFSEQPLPQEDTTANWLVPTLVIGGGVLVIGLLAYSVKGKKPVTANRRRRMRRNVKRLAAIGVHRTMAVRRAFAHALKQHRVRFTPADLHAAIRTSGNGVKISTETGLLADPYNVPQFQKIWDAAEKMLKKYGHPGYFESINAGQWVAVFDDAPVVANRRRRARA